MDAVAEVVVATSETDEHLAKRMSRSIYEQFVIPCVKQSANGTWITKTFPVDETTIGALVSHKFSEVPPKFEPALIRSTSNS